MNTPDQLKPIKLIGVVGGAASGKDTVAALFTEHGYAHVSSSDLVREEIIKRGGIPSRPLQTEVANDMRKRYGPHYWVDLSIRQLGTATRGVISGLYSPAEGEYLINAKGGALVSVIAGEGDDSLTRFNRLKTRGDGSRDDLTLEDFLAAHTRENGGTQPHETNLGDLHSMAQFIVYNTADLEYLKLQTSDIITKLEDL